MAAVVEALRYKDKVTIITGATSGIGKGILEVFVRHGAKVVFCSIAPEEEGKAIESKFNKYGSGECLFVRCDVTSESDVKEMILTTVQKYGRLDCLINNAGWHPPTLKIDNFTTEDFQALLNLNIVGYFRCAKYALPHLRKTAGNIINTSSLAGVLGEGGSTTYVASKGAVASFSRGLAIDEAKYNVRVNTLCPGNIWTPLFESWSKTFENPQECVEDGANQSLLGRYGTPEECGLACLFLAAEATFCTGIDITVSGGAELDFARKAVKKETASS